MKTEITKSQHLQIVGLLTLARKAAKMIKECEEAYIEILNIPQEYDWTDAGHFSDSIWDEGDVNSDVRKMLENEEVTVKK